MDLTGSGGGEWLWICDGVRGEVNGCSGYVRGSVGEGTEVECCGACW